MEYDSPLMQITLCIIASGSTISSGMNMAYPAVAIPAMNATRNTTNSDFKFQDYHGFLIASLPQITMVVGCLAAGPILDWKGRRLGLLLSTLFASAGWFLIASISSLWAIYTGRLLTGLAMGFTGPSEAVFVSEIASPSTRSALSVIKIIAFSIGVTLTYLFGFLFKTNWMMVSFLCGIFPTVCFILVLIFLPEPKLWKKKTTQDNIQLRRPEVIKPLVIMTLALFIRQVAGTPAIVAYAVEFAEKSEIQADYHMVAVILGITRLAGGIFAVWLSAKLGRRLPAIWTGVGMSICMFILATNFQLPVFALVMYVLTSTVNGAVPQAMAAEVFPTDVRGICTSVTSITMYLTSVLGLWAHQKVHHDKVIMFIYYGCISVASTLFLMLFLPETHRKTLTEIGYIYNKNLRINDEIKLSADKKLIKNSA